MKSMAWRPATLFFTLAFAVVLILNSLPASAESPEEMGLRIALEAEARDKGYGNYTAEQTMILRNKRGQESKRTLRISVLENEADGDKSLIVFNHPRDVKGTAMLTHTH